MTLGSFKNVTNKNLFRNHIFYIYINDLVLNNQKWLICYKIKPLQTKSEYFTLCTRKIRYDYSQNANIILIKNNDIKINENKNFKNEYMNK